MTVPARPAAGAIPQAGKRLPGSRFAGTPAEGAARCSKIRRNATATDLRKPINKNGAP